MSQKQKHCSFMLQQKAIINAVILTSPKRVNVVIILLIFLLLGYTDAKNSMWREQCMASCAQLTDPYLRAIFAFLTADSDSFDGVLVSNCSM